jgi:hypothetical protein
MNRRLKIKTEIHIDDIHVTRKTYDEHCRQVILKMDIFNRFFCYILSGIGSHLCVLKLRLI